MSDGHFASQYSPKHIILLQVHAVAYDVNGPLLEALVDITGFTDKDCIEFFRKGAPLLGKLDHSGVGEEKSFAPHASVDELWSACAANNKALVATRSCACFSDSILSH